MRRRERAVSRRQALATRGAVGAMLPGVPRSAGEARAFARRTLGPQHPALPAVEIAVSELATNAVLHTGSGLPGGRFLLILTATRAGVVVSVYDDGSRDVPHGPARAEGEHGRGLEIVAALADKWGTGQHDRGRVTWCLIGRHAMELAA
jgi:serine/threonine-protein kinase RsbW